MDTCAHDRLIGGSREMDRTRRRLGQLARSDAPVLVRGETGAGKEVVTRALHAASPRRRHPIVAVNCGALPKGLVESELFGTEAGAFTGARRREGRIAEADGGTLFLDEIGELPPEAQAVLLRVLETREVSPVGGRSGRRVDFRLVCATHRALPEMVDAGHFRADLYHRIATLVVDVPPLRARIEDIPELAAALLGAEPDLTPRAWRALRRHPWPGNVRELRNVLVRGLAEADGGTIDTHHLGLEPPRAGPATDAVWSGEPLRVMQRRWIRAALTAHGGNARAAARALGISPTTLYRHVGQRRAAAV
jgi:transcriptional regulator with PAS, ATPase and Fis domain